VSEELHDIAVTVNGSPRTATAPARRLLSDFLRHDLELTGTHVGCEHGVCGCCTVLLDGQPVRSCLVFAVSVRGREVTTVEGLAAEDGTLHPVQQALQDHHGLQCGFCTPGFVMSACGFLAERAEDAQAADGAAGSGAAGSGAASTPDLDHDEVREAMAGNLCRCTGYAGILSAVKQAATVLRDSGADPRARHDASAPNRPTDGTHADDHHDAHMRATSRAEVPS
jgi:aerobic carbon-monoxide dehydrogenase small subunit